MIKDEGNHVHLTEDENYLFLYRKSGNLMYKRITDDDVESIMEAANYGNDRESRS